MTTVDDRATIGRGGIDIAKSVGHAGRPRPVEHRISGFAVRHVIRPPGLSVLMAMPACAKQIVAGNNIESRRQVAIKRHVVLRAGLRRSGRGVRDEDEQRARAANARLTRVFPRLTTASVFLTSVSGKPESQ